MKSIERSIDMKRRFLLSLILVCILSVPITSYCVGPSVSKNTAAWDPPSPAESDLAGYYLYWKSGTQSFDNARRVQIATNVPTPTYLLTQLNLPAGVYTIGVAAYDTAGNESAMSNEVQWDNSYPSPARNLRLP
jgi:hypothetical protein